MLLLDLCLTFLELGMFLKCSLDGWSLDQPWRFSGSALFLVLTAIMAHQSRVARNRWRSSINNRKAMVELHEGIIRNDGLSRVEMLLDQYLASVNEIRKR